MPKSSPWFPNKVLTYGSLYFYIRGRTMNINPFNKQSIQEAKYAILSEAKKASPNNKMFIKAAILATELSEKTIKNILNKKETK